ncbi:MAG: CPBP family intramembrane metalloprotease [Oscillospiraceae bacterium]|nr:CPBP family intramembrane metalloprotease [Oscillospiraceae bacterium]
MLERFFAESDAQFARIRQHPAQRVPENPLLVLLLFWIVMLCAFSAERLVSWLIFRQHPALPQTEQLLVFLFRTNIMSVMSILFCRFIERRPLRTMGLTGRHGLRDYGRGILLGLLMFGAVMLTGWAGGAFRFCGTGGISGRLLYFLLAAGWMMQGFSEEITFRGWLMMSAGTRSRPLTAVIVSALSFAAAHLQNNGISVLAFCNVLLFGAVMSLVMLRTDSVWTAAGLHSTWNWAQGSFFGLPVSGIAAGDSVLLFSQTDRAGWLGGGAFGPESGLAATGVLVIMLLLLIFLPQNRRKIT